MQRSEMHHPTTPAKEVHSAALHAPYGRGGNGSS
jgi:hypothetical protein